eukprot:10922090-Lingulodinium_polyedra.AAC.1
MMQGQCNPGGAQALEVLAQHRRSREGDGRALAAPDVKRRSLVQERLAPRVHCATRQAVVPALASTFCKPPSLALLLVCVDPLNRDPHV